jgi:hypothetical protein
MDLIFASVSFLSSFCDIFCSTFALLLDPTLLYSLCRRLAISFILAKGYTFFMDREAPSDITINSNMEGGNPSNNRRKKTKAQKRARRLYARWLKAYVATYSIEVPGYNPADFMDVADLLLNKEFDYLDPQKTLSELNAIVRQVQRHQRHWPANKEDHPLTDAFDDYFDE